MRLHLALALVSLTTLVYELALMRLFSVTLWYYFAFFVISLALLGGGAAGAVLFVRRDAFRARLPAVLPSAAALFGLACAACPALYLRTELVLTGDAGDRLRLAGILFLFLVPFALGGFVAAAVLSFFPERFGSLYWADLAGAGLGCLAIVPLLWAVPTPELLALIGLLPIVAAALLARALGGKLLRPVPIGATALLVLLLISALTPFTPFRVRMTKHRRIDDRVDYIRWTPLARLSVYKSIVWVSDERKPFGWGMSTRFPGGDLDQRWIEQDESAGTPLTRFDGDPKRLDFLGYDVTNFAYQYRPFDDVLVVGAGGGRDILSAWRFGAKRITAVELNPGMVEIADHVFGDFSGRPYSLPGVERQVGEARSFLARSDRRWDLLQISLIDSWAASMAGAYALTENNLYTREAFRLYLDRLTPDGVLTLSRWYQRDYATELARLLNLCVEVLAERGVTDPGAHLAVVQGDHVGTVLLSARPFTAAERARMLSASDEIGFRPVWVPGQRTPVDEAVGKILGADADRRAFLDALPFDLSPPTDDQPFFFLVLQKDPTATGAVSGVIPQPQSTEAIRTLLALLLTTLLLTALGFILGPILLERRARTGLRDVLLGRPQTWLYFAAIGAGFMLVELSLVQRYVLFLGHPTYASSVVIFSLLVSAGAGSATTARARGKVRDAALRSLGAVLVLAALQTWLVPSLLTRAMGAPLWARIGIAVILLAPLGLAMGRVLPLGVARLREDGHTALLPYVWALNGVFSVFASALATVIAVSSGYTTGLAAGMGAYLIAGAMAMVRWETAQQPTPVPEVAPTTT